MWSAAGTVAGMVCPVSELTALARTYIPCLKPIPPPFHDDERFTDRLSDEDLKSLTNVTRALGLSYAEVQRYLRCFCCLDGLRLGKVSIRHISVHHSIKHTPFLDCVFSHLATPEGPPLRNVKSHTHNNTTNNKSICERKTLYTPVPLLVASPLSLSFLFPHTSLRTPIRPLINVT